MNFANIHPFLRERAKWAVWRYETAEGKDKPSKPPRSPINEALISPTSDEGWGTFEEAVARYGNGTWYNGVGFRIADYLGLAVLDLDYNANHHPNVVAGHKVIYDTLACYTEFSPSGKGLHIFCFGHVPSVKNSERAVEIYCKDRFMTVTGNVLYNGPIEDRQEKLEQLVSELTRERNTNAESGINYTAPQTENDETIIARASAAANGAKFSALASGNWTQAGYSSQSEADFAFVNILCFYTRNVEQVRRLFVNSGLMRDKMRERPQLLEDMIKRGYDRILPEIDTTALRLQLEEKLAQAQPQALALPEATSARGVVQHAIQPPPGLFGRVARFFYDAATYPSPEVALAGAIGFMSALFGSGWNVSGTGLNSFVLLTAPTAAGKDVLKSGTFRLVQACREFNPANHTGGALSQNTLDTLIGPTSIASGSALTKAIKDDFTSMLSIQSEFGYELQKFAQQNANAATMSLKALYLGLTSSSGKDDWIGKDIWADKENNTKARRGIAFSLLAESVPENVYDHLSVSQIQDGFLNRMLLIELPWALKTYNPDAKSHMPDAELVRAITMAAAQAYANTRLPSAVKDVNYSPEGSMVLEAYRVWCRDKHEGPDKPPYMGLWGRCHLKAIKLAALVAVGNDYMNPVITADCANWAIDVINRGTEVIMGRFDRGEIGREGHGARMQAAEAFLKDYATKPPSALPRSRMNAFLHANRQINVGYFTKHILTNKLFKEARDVTAVVASLVSSGVLVLVRQQDQANRTEIYQITTELLT